MNAAPTRPESNGATERSPRETHATRPNPSTELAISRFEQVSAWLLAIALFLGILVGMLAIIWLTRWPDSQSTPPPPRLKMGWELNEGTQVEDFTVPSEAEVSALDQPSVDQLLLALTDVVSSQAASINSIESPTQRDAAAPGFIGTSKRVGGPDGDADIVPRFERWFLQFSARDQAEYAAQLDQYGIELGVLGGGIEGVDYISDFADHQPQVRRGDQAGEDRLYFLWTGKNKLARYDQALAAKAGVSMDNRILTKFIPRDLENQLAVIELEYAREHGHVSVQEIAQTVFESRKLGQQYSFVVVHQRYR